MYSGFLLLIFCSVDIVTLETSGRTRQWCYLEAVGIASGSGWFALLFVLIDPLSLLTPEALCLPSGLEWIVYNFHYCHHIIGILPESFPGGSEVKAPACNVGDPGSIPGLGRSPGEGNGNPLQYSCLETPMDSGAWQATVQRGHKESDMTE